MVFASKSKIDAFNHGRLKDFFRRGYKGIFLKFFQGGPNVVKFHFSHSKLRKQPFFAKGFNTKVNQGPSLPLCSIFGSVHYHTRHFKDFKVVSTISIKCNEKHSCRV